MRIEYRVIPVLRFFLIALFALLVVFQTLSLPGQFAHMARENPDLAYLRWPMTVVAMFWILCIEVVVVATWKLLSLVRVDRIFSRESLGWVDAIVWSIALAWSVLVGVFTYVGVHADDPGLPMLLLLMVVIIAVAALLMIVMRALLRRATTLRTDLEGVI